MTGIQVNTEFLRLPPNLVMQMVRNSPYLSNEQIDGEYSLPINIPYTDINYRLLGFTGNHYTTHARTTINCTLYSDGIQYPGKLVIDSWEGNANQPQSLTIPALFVFAISDFFQQVKGKKLSDLALGGVRTFPFTTQAPFDGSNGFWQHVHTVMQTPVDYTFFPIKNDGYGEYLISSSNPTHTLKVTWMNKVEVSQLPVQLDRLSNIISLCPAIKLSYLIGQVFKENGWTLTGEVLQDATFQKLYVQSFRGIYWADYSTNNVLAIIWKTSVNVNLQQHVPPDYTIQDFIIDLKNRYGWAFVFDSNNRTCTLKFLKTRVNSSDIRDFTPYALSTVRSKFELKERIISLKNTIDSADSYPGIISDPGIVIAGTVSTVANLPATSAVNEGTTYLVFLENAYYQLMSDGVNQVWEKIADNIGDYLLPNETEAITTNISTFATSKQQYRNTSPGYSGFFPTCNQVGNWYQNKDLTKWGLRTIIYHGYRLDINNSGGTSGTQNYPYASPHSSDNYNNSLGGWSNVYVRQHTNLVGVPPIAINDGLYIIHWVDWLKLYKGTDLRTIGFNLPLYLIHTIRWEDVIIIQGVQFIIKAIRYNIPYDGVVEIDLLKI